MNDNEFQEANAYIYNAWLPKSSFKKSNFYQKQLYDSKHNFGIDDSRSEIDFYITIK